MAGRPGTIDKTDGRTDGISGDGPDELVDVLDEESDDDLDHDDAFAAALPVPGPAQAPDQGLDGHVDRAPDDPRTLTRALLARLAGLEPGTPEHAYVRGTLIELNVPMVRYAAARFRTHTEPMEDIVQVGTIGLIKSIDRFDPTRGVEFPSFAMPTILGEMKRFFRDTSWSVRVPRRLQEMRMALARAREELSRDLGRSPTVAELAARLGTTQEDVIEGMEAGRAYSALSLDAPVTTAGGPGGGRDGDAASPMDFLGDNDSAIDLIEHRESLRPLIAALPAREREILLLRFFGGLTQAEIGRRIGVSQMHVSRLLARTLDHLRSGLLADN